MRILPAVVVMGAVGAGYVYHQEQAGQTAPLSKLVSTGAAWVDSVIGEDSDDSDESGSKSKKTEKDAPASGASADLADVFRFDITPEQVRQSSKRVNVNVADGKMRGYRLPLVMGEAPQDLSGSVVYYFDGAQMRRITFVGSSGDPRTLIEFLHEQFGFQRVNSRNQQIETYSSRKNCSGLLRITPPDQPDARSQIDLSIAR